MKGPNKKYIYNCAFMQDWLINSGCKGTRCTTTNSSLGSKITWKVDLLPKPKVALDSFCSRHRLIRLVPNSFCWLLKFSFSKVCPHLPPDWLFCITWYTVVFSSSGWESRSACFCAVDVTIENVTREIWSFLATDVTESQIFRNYIAASMNQDRFFKDWSCSPNMHTW